MTANILNPKVWKTLYGLTLSPGKWDHQCLVKIYGRLAKKTWTNNLIEILDQAKQSIDANKYEHPKVTLTTTFHKPAG